MGNCINTSTTMTTALPSPSPEIQTTRASSIEYDTPAEAAAPAANTETSSPPPSIPDPQDECVLCCYPFPLKLAGSVYHECCGEVICWGCIIAQKRTLIIGTNVMKPIAGSKGEELEFIRILASKQTMYGMPILPCRRFHQR